MDTVSFDDFKKLDIGIGTVVKAEVPEWSHWVMKMTVDLGDPPASGGKKVCFSGIMKFFKPEEFIGKQYPFLINLEPKKIGPNKELSEAMMLMACPGEDDPASLKLRGASEETAPVLFELQEKVPNGTKVF